MADEVVVSTISSVPFVMGTVAAVIAINIAIRKLSGGFKRDAVNNSFGNAIVGSVSILSNKDSVLSRDGVKDSIEGYENLFTGAREGNITNPDSISTRKQEYKTMVNSFYDLVTDFYEWGWGQVRMLFL